jgi:hypothetical protein
MCGNRDWLKFVFINKFSFETSNYNFLGQLDAEQRNFFKVLT